MSGAVRSLNCHVQLWKINLDPLPSTTRKAWYRNNNIAFEKATPFRSFFFFFLSLFFISFQHALPRVATNTSPGKIKNYNISWHSLRTHYCTNISSKAKCSSSSTIVRKTNTSRMHSVEVGGKKRYWYVCENNRWLRTNSWGPASKKHFSLPSARKRSSRKLTSSLATSPRPKNGRVLNYK